MGAGDIDEAIHLILSGDATLISAGGFTDTDEQMVYGDDQYSEVMPRIVFEKITDPSRWQRPEKWQRWGFNITHTNLHTCEAIQNRVAELFSDGSGNKGSILIQNASIIDRGRTPLYNQGISAYQTRVDVRISYY